MQLTQNCLHGDSMGDTQEQSCGVKMGSILKEFNASILAGIAKDKSILTRLNLSSSLTKLRGGVKMRSIEKLNFLSSLVRGELSPHQPAVIDVPKTTAFDVSSLMHPPTPISPHYMQLIPETPGMIPSGISSFGDKVVPLSPPSIIETFLETALNDESVGISVKCS